MSQQILLAVGWFGLALICMLLLSALSRSGSLETEARALTLLKEWLSPKQRACYIMRGS